MSTTSTLMPISDDAVRPPSRRKSAPLTERYPKPDPHDPFAPLWVLRVRQAESATDLTTLGQEEPPVSISYPSPPASPISNKGKELEYPRSWQKNGHSRDKSNATIDPESVGPRPGWRRRSRTVATTKAKKREPPAAPLPRISRPKGYHSAQASISSSKTAPVVRTSYDSSTNTIELSSQIALENQRAFFSMNTQSSGGPLTFADDMPFSSEGAQFDHLLRFKGNFTRVRSPLAISTLPSPPNEITEFRQPPRIPKSNKLRRRRSSASAMVDYSRPSLFSSSVEGTRMSSDTSHDYSSQAESNSTITAKKSRKRTNSFPKLSLRRPASAGGPRGVMKELSHELSSDHDPVPEIPIMPFDENALPTEAQLSAAASLTIIAESGVRVEFGDLWRTQKTVVLFIRHFWCSMCQDYMFSISKDVEPMTVRNADVRLVIISNGSHSMIKSYRQIFHTPFEVYTDPSLRLYTALGMTRRTLDAGPEERKGEYIKHGLMSGIAMVVMNAVKSGMPVWEKGGDISQLGGEFILGPGLECSYAHRMTTTRGHEPILRVLAAAGVEALRLPMENEKAEPRPPLSEEEKKRVEERQKYLERLREKKGRRRRLGVSGEAQALEPITNWEKVERVIVEERDDDRLLAGGRAGVPHGRSDARAEKQDISWEKVVVGGREVGNLTEGNWRRGLERWDVIVDNYGHSQRI